MRKIATAFALTVIILAGCDDALAHASAARTRGAVQPNVASSYEIAYRFCLWDEWRSDIWCGIFVQAADGTIREFGYLEEPSWSPDGTKLAATDGGPLAPWSPGSPAEIFILTLGDRSIVNITNHPSQDHSPAWSPDGGRIAFVSDRDGPPELYVMNVDGSNVTRLTNGVGFRGSPDWSPDGTRIAFDCMIESGNYDVCSIGAGGTGLVRLTSDPAADYHRDFSPDGTRIAFITERYPVSVEVAVMDSEGRNVTRITNNLGGLREPEWSPDGFRIAFTVAHNAICSTYCDDSIFVMNANGSSVEPFAQGSQPAWRPGAADPPPGPDEPPVARFTYQCTDLSCAFDGSASSDDHGIRSSVWTFGDGTYDSYGLVVSHTFPAAGSYLATLTVTDWNGQTGTATESVTVTAPPMPDQPPIARFTYSCAKAACTLDGRSSTDDVGIVSYTWDLGALGTATGAVVTVTFRRHSEQAVTLTVRDTVGQTSSTTQTIVVR